MAYKEMIPLGGIKVQTADPHSRDLDPDLPDSPRLDFTLKLLDLIGCCDYGPHSLTRSYTRHPR